MTLTAWLMFAGGVLTAFTAGRWSVAAVAYSAASRARAARSDAVAAQLRAERAALRAEQAAGETLPFTRREL